MAIISCSECGKEVSNAAPNCPHCGNPIAMKKKKVGCCGGSISIVLVLFLIAKLSGSGPKSTGRALPDTSTPVPKTIVQTEQEKLVVKFGQKPSGGFDGVPREIKSYLKAVAKNPDSVKINTCTDVSVDAKSGWVVGCDWNAQNGFGGMNRAKNWFVIKNREVVKMLPGNAYK